MITEIPEDLYDALEALCALNCMERSVFMEQAFRLYLELPDSVWESLPQEPCEPLPVRYDESESGILIAAEKDDDSGDI